MISACKGMCMSSGDPVTVVIPDLTRADFDMQMAIPCSAMVSQAIGECLSLILCDAVKDGTRANFVLPGSALSLGTRVLFGRLD